MTESIDSIDLNTLAAITLVLIYLNLFYIVRVVDNLAWFNTLTAKTIKDLYSMLIMYMICLLTFSMSQTVLNKNRTKSGENQVIVDGFGNSIIDSLLT